jgi:polyphosphate kinase
VGLVIRQEGDGIRRYIHLATGNYNLVTSKIYEDIGMFTCDEEIGADATDLFNFLTGYSTQKKYRKLLVAPFNLRDHLETLILREIEHAKSGSKSHLIFKVNAIVDEHIIQLLYQASQAGVKVNLLVRGICCLVPGISGLSEHITVRSVVGRFLEHSRIFYFYNCGEEEVYLGSADLMMRNLNHRVEVVFPVNRKEHIRHLRDHVLEMYLKENSKTRVLEPDGSYTRLIPEKHDDEKIDVQERLMNPNWGKKPNRTVL